MDASPRRALRVTVTGRAHRSVMSTQPLALPFGLRTAISDADAYPRRAEQFPPWLVRQPPYRARFARTRQELEAIQRLRYRVFNLELGEGLAESRRTGRDADVFDETSHHILVIDDRSGIVVGTYRLATLESASTGGGFYSAQEFDLGALPASLLAHGAELGRACIAAPHRGRQVLALLFQGIAAYAAHNRKRFLFGCASLPASAAPAAASLTRALRESGAIDPALAVRPRPGFEAPAGDATAVASTSDLPPLVKRYLRLGARLGAEPALDRAFGTLDYFTLLDLERVAG
jgi:putative hemolysin